jgi:hypothetical protein
MAEFKYFATQAISGYKETEIVIDATNQEEADKKLSALTYEDLVNSTDLSWTTYVDNVESPIEAFDTDNNLKDIFFDETENQNNDNDSEN